MAEQDFFSVHLVKEWNEEALVALYRAGGWWKDGHDPAHLPSLVRSSFAFAVAVTYGAGLTIGMGRVISDGVADGYIQDVVVLPEYRQRGVGSAVVKKLVEFCLTRSITWIALIAEPGTEEFYTPLGFSRMENFVAMRYRSR